MESYPPREVRRVRGAKLWGEAYFGAGGAYRRLLTASALCVSSAESARSGASVLG